MLVYLTCYNLSFILSIKSYNLEPRYLSNWKLNLNLKTESFKFDSSYLSHIYLLATLLDFRAQTNKLKKKLFCSILFPKSI